MKSIKSQKVDVGQTEGVKSLPRSPQIVSLHLHVEDCSEELLRQQSYAIKNQLGHWGVFCLPLAGSLWHKGAYNRTFPCMEANYPCAIKNQRGASKIPLNGLVLYGIRL